MRIVLLGYGVMGRAVERLATAAGHDIVARIGAEDAPLGSGGPGGPGPDADADADVAIEFAGPDGAATRVREALAVGLPVVSGSTGWDAALEEVRDVVRRDGGAFLHAPNLSIGVALFERVVRRAARLLDAVPDYGIEVEETHHVRKVDHPSGTARWLADGIVERVARLDGWRAELATEGSGASPGGAPPGDAPPADGALLPVRCRREADVPGTHTIRATGPDDVIELTHRALRRDGFARGAVRAADWLHGRRGVYTLDDVLDDLLSSSPSDAT